MSIHYLSRVFPIPTQHPLLPTPLTDDKMVVASVRQPRADCPARAWGPLSPRIYRKARWCAWGIYSIMVADWNILMMLKIFLGGLILWTLIVLLGEWRARYYRKKKGRKTLIPLPSPDGPDEDHNKPSV